MAVFAEATWLEEPPDGVTFAPFVRSNQLIKKVVLAVPDAPDQHLFIEPLSWILQ